MTESNPGSRRAQGTPRRAAVSLVALAGLVVAVAQPARAASFSDAMDATGKGFAIVYDLAILRPLNAAALTLGLVFFTASMPLVAPVEGLGTAWDVFVYAPYEYTVLRDLGDF